MRISRDLFVLKLVKLNDVCRVIIKEKQFFCLGKTSFNSFFFLEKVFSYGRFSGSQLRFCKRY
jgi:hypothetical protein